MIHANPPYTHPTNSLPTIPYHNIPYPKMHTKFHTKTYQTYQLPANPITTSLPTPYRIHTKSLPTPYQIPTDPIYQFLIKCIPTSLPQHTHQLHTKSIPAHTKSLPPLQHSNITSIHPLRIPYQSPNQLHTNPIQHPYQLPTSSSPHPHQPLTNSLPVPYRLPTHTLPNPDPQKKQKTKTYHNTPCTQHHITTTNKHLAIHTTSQPHSYHIPTTPLPTPHQKLPTKCTPYPYRSPTNP